MKNTILAFSTTTFIALGLLSSSNGVAEIQNQDRTGAPGSAQSCVQCHNQPGSMTAESSIFVADSNGNEVAAYLAGETYEVSFNITSNSAVGYGFQATSVLSNGSNAGEFTNPGTSVQLQSVAARHIVEQSSPSPTGIFTANWTAPGTGSGDVDFYMAGLAANLQSQTFGDAYDGTTLSLTEDTNGIDEHNNLMDQPKVTSQGIDMHTLTQGTIFIYDVNGRLNFTTLANANESVTINSNKIGNGIQIIRFVPQDQFSSNFTPQSWRVLVQK